MKDNLYIMNLYGNTKYDKHRRINRFFENIREFVFEKYTYYYTENLDLTKENHFDFAFMVISRQTGRTTDMIIRAIFYLHKNPNSLINIKIGNNKEKNWFNQRTKEFIASLNLNPSLIKQIHWGEPKRGFIYNANFEDNMIADLKASKGLKEK